MSSIRLGSLKELAITELKQVSFESFVGFFSSECLDFTCYLVDSTIYYGTLALKDYYS